MKKIIRQVACDVTDVNFREVSNDDTSLKSMDSRERTLNVKKILGLTGCMVATALYFGIPEKPKNNGIPEKPKTDIQQYSIPITLEEGDSLSPLPPISEEAILNSVLAFVGDNKDRLLVTYRPEPDGPIFTYTTPMNRSSLKPKEICVKFVQKTDTPGLNTVFTRCRSTN